MTRQPLYGVNITNAVSLLYKWSHRGVKTIAQGRQLGNGRPCLSGCISDCSHCHHKALDKAAWRKRGSFRLRAAVSLTGSLSSAPGPSPGDVRMVLPPESLSEMPRVCFHGDSKPHQITPLYQPSVFPWLINLRRDSCIPKYKGEGFNKAGDGWRIKGGWENSFA